MRHVRPSLLVPVLALALVAAGCGGGGGGGGGGDATPPGPVTGLMLGSTIMPFEVQVSWTNPGDADFAGVVLAGAVGAPPVFTPVNGTSYTAGTPLPGDGEIVYVGAGTSFSAPAPIGDVYVAIYAFDAARNYSAGASAMLPIAEPPLTAQIQVSLAGVVTVTQQPPLLFLSGTAVYNGGAMQLDVDLGARNDFDRILFNLKALVTGTNEGTVTGDGMFGPDPYVYYGPEGQLEGDTVMRTITVNGVAGGTDPITLDITFRHDPMAVTPARYGGNPVLLDVSGAGPETQIDLAPFSFNDPAVTGLGGGSAGQFPGCFSPDARLLYLANRTQPALTVIDMSTLTPMLTTDLSGSANLQDDGTGSLGFTGAVLMSPDEQFLYASLTLDAHSYTAEGGSISGYGGPARDGLPTTGWIVKIDRETLVEVARVQLYAGGVNGTGAKGLALSRDGTRLACAARNAGAVYVVDAATMTVLDADPMTAGTQPYDVSGHTLEPRATAFSADGTKLYVAHAGSNDSTLDEIDLVTHAIGPVPPPASYAGYTYNYVGALLLGPDDRIWYAHPYDNGYPGVVLYDTFFAAWTERHGPGLPDYNSPNALTFSPDGSRYYVYKNGGGGGDYLAAYDTGTGAPIPFPATGLPTRDILVNGWGHTLVVSPW